MTGTNSSNVRVHDAAVEGLRGYRTESVSILEEVGVETSFCLGAELSRRYSGFTDRAHNVNFFHLSRLRGLVGFLRALSANELPVARRRQWHVAKRVHFRPVRNT